MKKFLNESDAVKHLPEGIHYTREDGLIKKCHEKGYYTMEDFIQRLNKIIDK